MSKMLVYVEDRILQSVEISLHFDDNSIEKTEAKVGDQLAIRYLYKKDIIEAQGRVADIIVNKFNKTIIKMDISTQNHSLIIYVPVDNIRGILTPATNSFIKLIQSLSTTDGYVDTIEEIVDQLTWYE